MLTDVTWLEKDPEPMNIPFNMPESNWRYQEIEVEDGELSDFSIVALFFITPIALSHSDIITMMPITSEEVYDKCLREIAPCFEDVKGVFVPGKDQPIELNFKHLKDHVKNNVIRLFNNNSLHPFISDLYGAAVNRPDGIINKTVNFKIKSQEIAPIRDNSLDDLWFFLSSTFLKDANKITLIPTNWFYSEDLKYSFSLRYFISKRDNIFLEVDDPSGRVIGLLIY
ncbi:hypothetical protein [Paenibacillus sp.]|jgi:hypothetical protein|uniref:hypothetical protein n=1 Tax=Paenibacillus sp. TaxID=58172 RepID=UPI0028224E46|nr:hypothetical protein [Paenibacillus sp.]MDR0270331.1 hypothetical protein [Paenibacillus sp.]